jgi:outer membrane protein OmpA-like peptidoglycan-associated protein
MLHKIVFLLALFVTASVSAQTSKMRKADNYMAKLSYSYALTIYEKLERSEKSNTDLERKIGICYALLGNTEKAENAFRMVTSSGESIPQDFLMFAEILKLNNKSEQSKEAMRTYSRLVPKDSRSVKFMNDENYIEKINSQAPYFDIRNITCNSSSADFGAYPNGQEVYVISARKNSVMIRSEWSWNKGRFLDIYKGELSAENQITSLKRLNSKSNSKFHEGPLCFSADGRTVYFTRNNISKGKSRKDSNGIQNLKLYRSEISTSGKWTNPAELPCNSTSYSTGHPTLSKEGNTLYFVSDMPGGYGETDIYKVAILENGTFGQPENLGPEINTEGKEMFPWIGDEGILYFSSTGHQSLGGLDMFASLPDNKGGYSAPINLGRPINSERDDFAFIMIPGKSSGFFSSNRLGGLGDDDVYGFTQLRPLKRNLMLELTVNDVLNNLPIENSKVVLLNKKTGEVITQSLTDNTGKFTINIDPDMDYELQIERDNYYPAKLAFNTANLTPNQDLVSQLVQLQKDPGFGVFARISDRKSNNPIDGVLVTITDLISGNKIVAGATDLKGEIQQGIAGKNINDPLSFKIELFKEGYFPKTVKYTGKITQPGLIDLSNVLKDELKLDPEVKDLSEMIQINPINFDLNKFTIRSDAARELDKIVEIMNKYPDMIVELGSHTDCRASEQYNLNLSDKRAKASAAYIKAKISNPDRIYGKGYGESRLLNECACEGNVKSDCSEEKHAENRRTEFKVISTGSDKVKVKN